jgi:rubrerythrin
MAKTASQCLRAAERMESLAQNLYLKLADAFAAQPRLHSLFRQLAAEEAQHAMRIRLLERHRGSVLWSADVLDRSGNDLDAMTAEIETMRKELERQDLTLDAEAVLQRLATMEDRFRTIHAQELARCSVPGVHELFASLALQDTAHMELLRAAMTSAA